MDKVKIGILLENIKETNPLIHNITNIVVANFSANGLLALGASPVMSSAPEEVGEMAKVANAVVLNIGTLRQAQVDAMIIAGKSANEQGIPVILDPVGVGATSFRTMSARRLVQELKLDFIRGNAAEIANLVGEEWTIKGVDAGSGSGNRVELAISAAKRLQSVVIVTGKEDVISDGKTTYLVHNGHPLLTKVTGTGCLLSAIVGAFAAVETNQLDAAASALTFYGIAAEIAAEKTALQGPGSFQIEFLNQLSLVSVKEIGKYASFKQI